MIGVAGIAAAGAAVLGMTPTLSVSPQLAAEVYYLRGTNIGAEPTDGEYRQFIDRVFIGTDSDPGVPIDQYTQVVYNAGLWPFSKGGLSDLKWNDSVQQGVDNLETKNVGPGDVVFGFSQGAVAVSEYRAAHQDTGATYILVENPSRPNGGVMSRFEGLTIPILDITFSGATPDTDDATIDIARQYDGWADFPVYPLNLLATVNAIAGIYYVHGKTQTQLTAEDLEIAEAMGPEYYQPANTGLNTTNTTYYLIRTERLPILMPFTGIVPEPILIAIDKPIRVLVEAGYDRTDYSQPTRAQLIPKVNPIELAHDLATATAEGISEGLAAAGASTLTPSGNPATARAAHAAAPTIKPKKQLVLKQDVRQRDTLEKQVVKQLELPKRVKDRSDDDGPTSTASTASEGDRPGSAASADRSPGGESRMRRSSHDIAERESGPGDRGVVGFGR